ncbi:MAG: hypothetical protein JRJ19_00960 [Deltaproteobacteria bacterium]|nr:hypothetical protein [Deltaproteobacteria bacterium]MBW1870601.1 hypothetical protein [Deltaproteobacteria bacterium]
MKALIFAKLVYRNLVLLLAFAVALMASGCEVRGTIYPDGGEIDPTKNQFLIQSIGLNGTTQVAAAVFVEGLNDQDGVGDTNWLVNFILDGGGQDNSLPEDNGEKQTYTLRVKAVQAADQEEFHKKVTITLYD